MRVGRGGGTQNISTGREFYGQLGNIVDTVGDIVVDRLSSSGNSGLPCNQNIQYKLPIDFFFKNTIKSDQNYIPYISTCLFQKL